MQIIPPVLFLIFNRPEIALESFRAIQRVRPSRLFIAADGPRAHKEGEAEKCEQTRRLILEAVDWDCEVQTLFRADNLGCGVAVSQAISWFFEHVEAGIILEDDIIAEDTFFPFCGELLHRYQGDSQVMLIGGMNFVSSEVCPVPDSYVFTNYATTWGWASWRRAWEGYDRTMAGWKDGNLRRRSLAGLPKPQRRFFQVLFEETARGRHDTWDYQWWFHRFARQGIGITPQFHLTRNIGFIADATHTFDAEDTIKLAVTSPVIFPLRHPAAKAVDQRYDRQLSKQSYRNEGKTVLSMAKEFAHSLVRRTRKALLRVAAPRK